MTRATSHNAHSFDYSTPEAQAALEGVSDALLEVRDEYAVTLRPEILRSFDFSTPEALEAIKATSCLILEIREECTRVPQSEIAVYQRKIALYERSLGLGVIPVLIRRVIYKVIGRLRSVPGKRS